MFYFIEFSSSGSNLRLRIALQKSGRLHEGSTELLAECGLKVQHKDGKLRVPVPGFDAEVLFLRDDDIPGYVETGVADIAIVGENIVQETGRNVRIVERLNFARCRLSIAVPENSSVRKPEDLRGLKIATSYPRMLRQWLMTNDIPAAIHEISGSVEIAPNIGLADAICDIISSGGTLLSNGLRELTTVSRSEAVLITSPSLPPGAARLLDDLVFRINTVITARQNRYILLNLPEEKLPLVTEIIPGIKSPTVLPLARTGWISVHSVVPAEELWQTINRLRAIGAQGILVIPIEKMVII